jgi:cyclic pyranopterin monophosphate synthase
MSRTEVEPERGASAESVIVLSPEGFAAAMAGDVLGVARIAGIMAAKKACELIPLRHVITIGGAEVQFAPLPERRAIRIVATVKTSDPAGAHIEALTAASVAGLTIHDMVKDKSAVIEGVKLVGDAGKRDHYKAKAGPQRRSTGMAASPVSAKTERARPQVLMGEVAATRAPPAPDQRREAFRSFMTSRRLRPSQWAKDAGVPLGEIMGFLNGRSRGFSAEIADKLAQAAKVRADDMFR